MPTEDDTFKALCKQPWAILRERVMATPNEEWQSRTDEVHDEWFKSQGWTYNEYIRAYLKHLRENNK